MRLIELHNGILRYSLNTDFITNVGAMGLKSGCHIWILGEPTQEPVYCDESYEEVIRLIRESERGTDEKM